MVKIDVIMYHQVGMFEYNIKTHRANYCHVQRFKQQIYLLKKAGYKTISLDILYKYLIGEKVELPKKSVILTFDDGYENFYQYAFPVLQDSGFSAIVYLIANKIGGVTDWFEVENRETATLMSLEKIRELMKYGVEFGSHGTDHLKLTNVDKKVARKDIFESKKILEDMLGKEIRHFCYPYGDHNIDIMNFVKEAGFKTGVTCERGAVSKNVDPYAIPRKAVSLGDSILGFAWKLFFKNNPKRELLKLE